MLPPLGQEQPVGDTEQVAAKRRAVLVSSGVLQDDDEDVVDELFGAAGISDPAAKEPPDDAAMAFEQRFERLARSGSHVAHQLLVSHHDSAAILLVHASRTGLYPVMSKSTN